MTITTNHILKFLQVLAWIIFIGLCIEAGSLLFNIIYTLFFDADDVKYYWGHADLSALYNADKGNFVVMCICMAIAAVLRAIMFYVIIDVFHNKKLTLSNPFNEKTYRFVLNMGYVALGIALFTHGGVEYANWLKSQGITMPPADDMRLAGADVWLLMSVALFIVSQIFKKGIELQTENDLTV